MSRAATHAPGPDLRGTLLAFTSAASFAALPILVQLAPRLGFPRHPLLAWRFLTAGCVLLAALAISRRASTSMRMAGMCFLLGLLGYASQAWLFFTAVARTGAGSAAVLLYLYPSFVVLLAWWWHGERPGAARLAALVLALAGCVVLTASDSLLQADPVGVAAGVGTAALYALYLTVSGVVLKGVGALVATAWVSLGTGSAFALLAWLEGSHTPTFTAARGAYVLLVALAGTVLPIVTLFAAIARIGVARAALLSTIEPVVTIVLAIAVLGERFGPWQALGAALVLSSVVLVQRADA